MSRRGASRRRGDAAPVASGHEVRAGRDVADIVSRAGAGDVVVISRLDLDPDLARELIARRVYAVVNAEPSLSGRFPSAGPLLLVRANIVLVDGVAGATSELRDGERVAIAGGTVQRNGQVVAEGRRRSDADLLAELEQARAGGGSLVRAEALLADSVSLLRGSPGVVDGVAADPELVHVIDGRSVVVVAADLSDEHLRLVRDVVGDPTWCVVAADAKALSALTAFGLAPDAVVAPGPAPIPTTFSGVRCAPALGGAPFEAALVTVLTAGAPVVVPVGAGAHDLIEALDQSRAVAASAAVARMVGAGRVVHVETLRALGRAAPLDVSPRGRRVRERRPSWVVPTAIGAVAALAGLALGLGPAAGLGGNDDALQQAQAARAVSQERAALLETELAQTDAFGATVQASLVAGKLNDRRLVLVVAPRVPEAVVAGTQAIVTEAGGTWSGTVTTTAEYFSPDRATSLDDIALRLAPPETQFPESAPAGARRDAALSASLVIEDGESRRSTPAAGYLSALGQVGAVEIQGEPQQRAALAVLLVPSNGAGAASAALADLARALAAAGGVVVGAPETPASSATLSALRTANPAVARLSTVDGVQRAFGRIAIVEASAEAFDGTFGAFGPAAALLASAASGSTPGPTPTG